MIFLLLCQVAACGAMVKALLGDGNTSLLWFAIALLWLILSNQAEVRYKEKKQVDSMRRFIASRRKP